MKCEGRCEEPDECIGNVVTVHVVGSSGRDWGNFNYCETAMALDRENGFIVTKIKDGPTNNIRTREARGWG